MGRSTGKVPNELLNDLEFMRTCFNQNHTIFRHLPQLYQRKHEMIVMALSKNGNNWFCLTDEHQQHVEFFRGSYERAE